MSMDRMSPVHFSAYTKVINTLTKWRVLLYSTPRIESTNVTVLSIPNSIKNSTR